MTLRASGAAAFALLAFAAAAFGAQPALAKQAVIPLHLEHGSRGEPRLGIDVTVGGRTLRLLLSTATSGMRVLASAVPKGAAEPTGATGVGGFPSGLMLHTERARARLAFAGASGSVPALIALVDRMSCAPIVPDCPAANGATPENFGGLFSGMLGISNVPPPAVGCCPNPFDASGWYSRRYIVHAAFDAPSVTLDPRPAALRRFTMVSVVGEQTPLGCVRLAGGVSSEVCGEVVFDTAAPNLRVVTNQTPLAAPIPPGTTATLTVGDWSHTFAAGPGTDFDVVVRSGPANRIVVGLAVLRSVDLFYDLPAERIGLRALSAGVEPAAPARAPVPAILGRWRCTSSEWPNGPYELAFAANRTGTKTSFDDRGAGTATAFTYMRVGADAIAMRTDGTAWGRERITLSADALELSGGGYWHESHWTAFPGDAVYRCTRDRAAGVLPRQARLVLR
jgi:hypothetical protein